MGNDVLTSMSSKKDILISSATLGSVIICAPILKMQRLNSDTLKNPIDGVMGGNVLDSKPEFQFIRPTKYIFLSSVLKKISRIA